MITRKIATFAFIFAIVALVIGLSSCERISSIMPDAETPSMEDETPPMTTEGITIGVALGLTGANANRMEFRCKRVLSWQGKKLICYPPV